VLDVNYPLLRFLLIAHKHQHQRLNANFRRRRKLNQIDINRNDPKFMQIARFIFRQSDNLAGIHVRQQQHLNVSRSE